jgi:hypothetical protein
MEFTSNLVKDLRSLVDLSCELKVTLAVLAILQPANFIVFLLVILARTSFSRYLSASPLCHIHIKRQ